MSITNTASRIRPESAAKNGTLGTQGALGDNQIKFDTNISTNNSNLMASPVFRRRHVRLRPGETDEEYNMVISVDVDGVTCTMYEDWDVNPASGDTYDVAYRLEDLQTIAGCDYDSTLALWTLSKRLVIGTAAAPGFLGLSHGQILHCDDRGPGESAIRVNAAGTLCIGTIKGDRGERGASIVFHNDADDEDALDFNSTATGRLYEFSLTSALAHTGINGLVVTIGVTSDVEWARAQLHGMNAPFKKRVKRIKDQAGEVVLTKTEVDALPELNGWCVSSLGQSMKDALVAETGTDKVHILIEDK